VEYPAPPYVYDVVWKEVEGLPRPCHVFEVQDKGSVDGALAKLQHARDIWKPRLFLVVTGEKDRKKVDLLLKPFLDGTFHGISRDTTVLNAEVVDEIHDGLDRHREVIRHFLEA
jgi:putative lipoic acid-binding regulatory protein